MPRKFVKPLPGRDDKAWEVLREGVWVDRGAGTSWTPSSPKPLSELLARGDAPYSTYMESLLTKLINCRPRPLQSRRDDNTRGWLRKQFEMGGIVQDLLQETYRSLYAPDIITHPGDESLPEGFDSDVALAFYGRLIDWYPPSYLQGYVLPFLHQTAIAQSLLGRVLPSPATELPRGYLQLDDSVAFKMGFVVGDHLVNAHYGTTLNEVNISSYLNWNRAFKALPVYLNQGQPLGPLVFSGEIVTEDGTYSLSVMCRIPSDYGTILSFAKPNPARSDAAKYLLGTIELLGKTQVEIFVRKRTTGIAFEKLTYMVSDAAGKPFVELKDHSLNCVSKEADVFELPRLFRRGELFLNGLPVDASTLYYRIFRYVWHVVVADYGG